MDGDGHFSRRMHQISRSLPATKGIAWAVMFQLSQPTGYTYKATRSSNRNSQQTFKKLVRKSSTRRIAVKKFLLLIIAGVGVSAAFAWMLIAHPVAAAQPQASSAVF